MTNNKAREVNNPIIKQLLDETTAEELAKIDAEMTNNKQQTMKTIISKLTMRRVCRLFEDKVVRKTVYLYKDKYDVEWMALKPFYFWNFRVRRD
jgi:hypothetical protein